MHSFVCNDAKRLVGGINVGGSAFRAGRWFVYAAGRPRIIKASWSFWNTLNWLEAYVRFGGENPMVTAGLILPRLAYVSVGIGVPARWLSWWMIEDRIFALKVGYVSSILRVMVAHADWAEDCGMTDYYRLHEPRKFTDLQLWPGLKFTLRFPPLLRWVFGKETVEKTILDAKPVSIELDGRLYQGGWQLEKYERRRPRWPWPYRVSVSSWIEMPRPPQFAGKGENSWDCDDDGIYGFGCSETTVSGAAGEYMKSVLKNRERYGMPRRELDDLRRGGAPGPSQPMS